MHQSRNFKEPELRTVTAVAPSILSLYVEEGWIEGGIQVPYEEEPGEVLEADKDIPHLVYIVKDGERIGVKVPDKMTGDKRFPFEKFCGDRLAVETAEKTDSYGLNGKRPVAVYRKSKPSDIVDPYNLFTIEYRLYLVFEEKFVPGKQYQLTFAKGLFDKTEYSFTFDPHTMFSDAVHVSQIGFRRDDPSKRAFLNQWMGLGGGISYTGLRKFEILNEQNEAVYEGNISFQHNGSPVMAGIDEITAESPVYEMDFSDFCQEGTFRICVPELGCSYRFPIGEKDTWLHGFRANMNALYCHRSGIKTGKPYTDFERPRVYHPDDGRVIYHSECSLFESGNGGNCYGTDHNNFGNLVRKRTDKVVENAWGGYFDACDWDRRIQHLHATLMQQELYLMFPDFFDKIRLPIPESGNGIPDILNEGLYNVDFYRRLQTPEGGIRGGIEAEEHPILGQGGWQDSWTAFAYAPDFWSAYYYTAGAARAACALRSCNAQKAAEYEESAVRAFDWAEKVYAAKLASEGHKWTRRAKNMAVRQRELAAADLFRLTGRRDCDEIYRALRHEKSYEAAFVYATLPAGMGDGSTKASCVQLIIDAAERALVYAKNAPFHLTTGEEKTVDAGPHGAFYTIPHNVELIRAHFLTGDQRYLAGAIDACQFGAGANPNNLCYTTGIGSKYPLNTLHHDSRLTGQATPVGITVYGPHNWNRTDEVLGRVLLADPIYPGAFIWPSVESYIDIYRDPCQTEYTVMESLGPSSYIWGYLAARKAL